MFVRLECWIMVLHSRQRGGTRSLAVSKLVVVGNFGERICPEAMDGVVVWLEGVVFVLDLVGVNL